MGLSAADRGTLAVQETLQIFPEESIMAQDTRNNTRYVQMLSALYTHASD